MEHGGAWRSMEEKTMEEEYGGLMEGLMEWQQEREKNEEKRVLEGKARRTC